MRRPVASLALAVACGLGLIAGCSGTRDIGPFSIKLVLDPDQRCASTDCAAYGMSCGAAMFYRIVDLETGEQLASRCVELVADADVCSLGALSADQGFGFLPPHRIRIEFAAWRPDLMIQIDGQGVARVVCPTAEQAAELFSLDGGINPVYSPQPAFGGSAVFDVGSDATEAIVPLACSEPAQLDADECSDLQQTRISARVSDIETSLTLTAEQAAQVQVSAVAPLARAGGDGVVHVINALDTIQLEATGVPNPLFVAEVDDADLRPIMCTLVRELKPLTTDAVVCQGGAAVAGQRDLAGLLVPRPVLVDVLDARGGDFPASGLLVGRVVDHTGAPLAGVTVTPSLGQVSYLSAERQSLGGVTTSASGYFVATDVPFDTAFAASHPDGRVQQGTPRAGLIENHLTALVLTMTAP
jgi:hypothetical protein